MIRRWLPVLMLLAFAGRAMAWQVYVNPSIQTANVSPDRSYNEGYAMQDVANRLMTKLTTRGFQARNSAWLSLSAACSDAVNWGADAFVALHTNASGSGSWTTAHGTEGFYYTSSGGWYDAKDVDLCNRCVHKCVEKFNAWGRGYDRGTFGDYPYFKYNLYVLANTPGMNSVLVEGLFHTNKEDTAVLNLAAGKDAYAQAIYEAICDFYGWSYVAETWNSQYNAKSFTATMYPGQQAVCWVEYKNTGNTTWQNTGTNPVRLGTWNPQDRNSAFYTTSDWISAKRPTMMDTATCAPNEIERFSFIMTAPQQTGTYDEYWRLVAENKAWFGDSSVHFSINVVQGKGGISGKVTNSVNGTPVAGATITLNTGQTTTTSSTGTYSFSDLPPATYTLTASRALYNNSGIQVNVVAGSMVTGNIALIPTDTQAPTVPTGLSAKGISSSEILLNWSPSSDDTGVAGYHVFRNGTQIATVTGTSYVDSGLAPSTTNSYRVSAYDALWNESAPGDPVSGTSLPPLETFTSPSGFVRADWNSLSLPATPANPDPASVLSGIDLANAGLQYWRNDLPSGGYQLYGSTAGWTGPMACGNAYWFLGISAGKTISFSGYRNLADWRIDIPAHPTAPYWITVGHPFEHSTLCSDVLFANASHPTPLGWGDAYRAGMVESQALGYVAGSFVTTGPAEFLPARDRFDPWMGYWLLIRTTEPVTITIPVTPAAP